MDKLTEEQQHAWDVLRTPKFESPLDAMRRTVDEVCRNYVGMTNNTMVRSRLEAELRDAIERNLLGKLSEYKILCNEVNNPPYGEALTCNVVYKLPRSVDTMSLTVKIQ